MSDTHAAPNASRFTGKLMQAWFTTDFDIESMMPPALEIAGAPNRAFIKVYELKARQLGRPILGPGHSQYKQICVSIMVRPKGTDLEPRQHNLFMWEARGWAMGTGGLAWPKKQAEMEITQVWPIEAQYPDLLPLDYRVEVRDFNAALMTFDGVIDGIERVTPPPLNGFYIPDNNDPTFVYHLALQDSFLGEPLHGTGTLEFGFAPYEVDSPSVLKDSKGRPLGRESAGVLGKVDVEGFVLQDVMFYREYGTPAKIYLP
jgi:hypothetical protein